MNLIIIMSNCFRAFNKTVISLCLTVTIAVLNSILYSDYPCISIKSIKLKCYKINTIHIEIVHYIHTNLNHCYLFESSFLTKYSSLNLDSLQINCTRLKKTFQKLRSLLKRSRRWKLTSSSLRLVSWLLRSTISSLEL